MRLPRRSFLFRAGAIPSSMDNFGTSARMHGQGSADRARRADVNKRNFALVVNREKARRLLGRSHLVRDVSPLLALSFLGLAFLHQFADSVQFVADVHEDGGELQILRLLCYVALCMSRGKGRAHGVLFPRWYSSACLLFHGFTVNRDVKG